MLYTPGTHRRSMASLRGLSGVSRRERGSRSRAAGRDRVRRSWVVCLCRIGSHAPMLKHSGYRPLPIGTPCYNLAATGRGFTARGGMRRWRLRVCRLGPCSSCDTRDNTLLDNDVLKADLEVRLRALLGEERAERFWRLYGGCARRRGRCQRFPADDSSISREPVDGDNALLQRVRDETWRLPFAGRLIPRALEDAGVLYATIAFRRSCPTETGVSAAEDRARGAGGGG